MYGIFLLALRGVSLRNNSTQQPISSFLNIRNETRNKGGASLADSLTYSQDLERDRAQVCTQTRSPRTPQNEVALWCGACACYSYNLPLI